MREDDKFHEECGVFGVWNAADAAALAALGLHALQHRGQEASGIVSLDEAGIFHSHKGQGLVGDNFSDPKVMASLRGRAALGHNRYATTGETALRNVQPLYADFAFGGFAVAHNGNLTNAHGLRRELVRRGCLFQSTTDSEVFIHLIAISLYSTVADRLIDALRRVQGAYSLVALHGNAMIGARDPFGVRPLVLGRLGGGPGEKQGWVLSSETCALDIVGAEFVRDVEPGEIVLIDDNGVQSLKPFGRHQGRFCVFEYIYFARPDSVVEGTPVYDTRKRIGAELARESGVPADVVVPVPDSGVPAAMGYAVEAGIPSPPTTHSCHYGIDTPERAKLLAAQHDLEEMARIIGVDSLAFISLDGLYRALGKPAGRDMERPGFCDACFTGDYAIPLTDAMGNAADRQLSLLQVSQ